MRFRAFHTGNSLLRAARLLLALAGVLLPLLVPAAGFAADDPTSDPSGAPAPAAAGGRIFVPVAVKVGRPVPPPPPPPTNTVGSFFVARDGKTFSANAKVDANGGMHMAFAVFASVGDNPPLVYAYCPGPAAVCATDAGWKGVALSDTVGEVQLQLTPDGKPRLLVQRYSTELSHDQYVYGECDSNCTAASQWQFTTLVTIGGTDVFGKDNPQHSFALDPWGRPRFVFTNGYGAGWTPGVYYAYCDEGCNDANNWYATQIEEGPQNRSLEFDFPALTFTSDGRPRIIANMSFSGEAQGVRYLECDTNCGDLSGWASVALYPRGGGVSASWDLVLDPFDRPRVAFYQASTNDGSGDRLFYASCNSDCVSAASWQRTPIGLPQEAGQNADLELDAQGRPRIAYEGLLGNGLGYSWCNSGCESAAGWQHTIVESAAKLQADFPVVNPVTCDPSFWTDAIPSLTLDAAGNPRIAYDNLSAAKCYYQNPGDPNTYSRIEKLFRAVRWLQFNQP